MSAIRFPFEAFLVILSLVLSGETRALAGPAGTRITATKTATAEWQRQEKYSWSLIENLQVPTQVTLVIPQGQKAVVGFNLVATRLGPEVLLSGGTVSGEVCVTNTGSSSTEGLRIRDQLEQEVSPGIWRSVARTTIPVRFELRARTRRCYPYQFSEALDPAANYRNKAIIAIDNFSGYEGQSRSITVITPVEARYSTSTLDASATLFDPFSCPAGFSCELSGTSTFITDSLTVPFTVLLSNVSAPCGQTLIASDTGTLVPTDTQVPVTAYAEVSIFTGSCRPGDARRGTP
jgi:hypothetical protein